MSAEVIVVGAGYGGLTAGAVLAHKGVFVEVFEATGHIGGRATYDYKDGFIVDYGIHANRYGAEGAAAAALKEIGYQIEFVSMGEPLLFHEGSFTTLPTGVPQFIKAPFISAIDKLILVSNLGRLVLGRYDSLVDIPLERALRGSNRKEIRSVFSLLSGIGLISPDITKTSSGDFSYFLKRALRAKENVAFPKGGTSQIIDALEKKIGESGKINTHSRVKSIKVENGSVKSVTVKGEEHKAKAYIFALPLQKLVDLVEEGLPDRFLERCRSIVPTAGISIDLCLSEKVSDINGLIVTGEPVTMGQFTSNIDTSTAPEGKQLATFYYPLPVDAMDEKETVEAEEKRFIELLETMFPRIMDKVEWRRILALKMVDGFEPRVGQSAKYRPGVRAPGVDNLFFAGDTVSAPGSGGDVAFQTGVEAARRVLEMLG